jgi:hypothetical protein
MIENRKSFLLVTQCTTLVATSGVKNDLDYSEHFALQEIVCQPII